MQAEINPFAPIIIEKALTKDGSSILPIARILACKFPIDNRDSASRFVHYYVLLF